MSVPALLLQGGEVFDPASRGQLDILTVGDRIVALGDRLELPLWADGTVLDARGFFVMPGLIDQHVHIAGGGGEGGPQYRTPEIFLTRLTRAGITTVVGVLGTDGTTRSVQELLAKARALTLEGINAWIYTGAYQVPTRTITDSARNDIILIDRVLGIGEIALSDQRGSHPSDRELARLAGEARVGGLLSGKAGVLHLHVGNGPRQLTTLFDIMKMADVPIQTFVPTHLNRNRSLLDDAVLFAKKGGTIDLTASIEPTEDDPHALSATEAIRFLRAEGVPWNRVSMSSDAQGSAPVFNARGQLVKMGIGGADSLWKAVVHAKRTLNLTWTEVLMPVTETPRSLLKLRDLGRIAPGARADLLLIQDDAIHTVVAGGRVMVREGRPEVFGTYEEAFR